MAIAICSECGSPVEIAKGEEWGYCPMCENDQVELNKNLKLSLENAVEFKVDKRNLESPEETDKEINNFVKGLLYKDFIERSYKIDILEKALELACKWLNDYQYFDSDCPRYSDCFNVENSKFWDCENCDCSQIAIEYFKTKAKEMMKSE